jgi:hypothetical protein
MANPSDGWGVDRPAIALGKDAVTERNRPILQPAGAVVESAHFDDDGKGIDGWSVG